MKKNENKDIDLSRYKDSGGLTVEKMYFGLWLSKNRKLFFNVVIGVLVIMSAFFIIFSAINYVRYFLDLKHGEDVSNNNVVTSPRKLTNDIISSKVHVFRSNSSYDLAIKLENPNEKFITLFSYCFLEGTKEIECGNNFIFPNENKYIISLGKQLQDDNDITFVFKKIDWQRINIREIPDWKSYKNSHIRFLIEDLNFSSANSSALSERVGLNTLSFNINNNSPFSFYQIPINILLFNGTRLVGVNKYLINDFYTEQTREVKIVWQDNLPRITKTKVVPEINILDKSVYQQYSGEGVE